MALNGTLEELAVLDLVQFVNQARMSGALSLTHGSDRAELFYRKGSLVHARFGTLTGVEVLVQIVDWVSGSFAFQPGTDAPEETIRMDLHRAVMHALKTRDERKLEADKKSVAQARPREISLDEHLAETISQFEFVQSAAIFDATGMLASGNRKGDSASSLEPLCKCLLQFGATYVRGRFRRIILDDEEGTILVSGLRRNRWVVVLAERGAALGGVMTGMGRLVAKLEAPPSDRQPSQRETLVGVA